MIQEAIQVLDFWQKNLVIYLYQFYNEINTKGYIDYILSYLSEVTEYFWILIIMLALFIRVLSFSSSPSRHQRYIKTGDKAISALKRIRNSDKSLNYLRAVNPYVFEEMVLSALKSEGHKITRSLSYSGDNGIDGRVVIRGKKILIQAKRYTGYIDNKHVSAFKLVCKEMGHKGIFIHTGRTGKLSSSIAGKNIDIVSGERMLKLMKKKGYSPSWQKV
jgi:restriction system protein